MEEPSSPNSYSDPKPQIEQNANGDRNQMISQMFGGIVVYCTVFYSNPPAETGSATTQPKDLQIGANPYKGLLAFQETDGKQFFGRDPQIQELWNKFCRLREKESATRLLTIYGPSGSGKSSLARAGLIPELSRRLDRARVAVLVPGSHPLESLATVLARIATNDLTPITKANEFKTALAKKKEAYEGLRQITDMLPDIEVSPLIVMVDQLDEIFTLCEDSQERDAFIGNLLCAAADPSQKVLVIVTLRSDFLGEIQKYSDLNQLIADQGYLVTAMNDDGMREAITKPAELAGHPLDLSTVNLLIEQTAGREGALPLLQFALTQIWIGLEEGMEPAKMLGSIGGVGGALAGEAQKIFEDLTAHEKKIARRVFLGLVHLGEGAKDTRRRIKLERLVAHGDNLEQVQKVVDKFAKQHKRLITLADDNGNKTAEVTHETLFDNWQQLQDWLKESRNYLPFQRRLDDAVTVWLKQERPEGTLWRSPDLDLLRSYQLTAKEDMTPQQLEFFHAAEQSETNQRQLRQLLKMGVMTGFVLMIGLAGFATYQSEQAQRQQVEQLATAAEALVETKPVEAQIHAIAAFNLAQSMLLKFSQYSMPSSIQNSLLEAKRLTREKNILPHDDKKSSVDAVGALGSVAFSINDHIISASASREKIRIWESDVSKESQKIEVEVNSVAFSKDGTKIVGGSPNGHIEIWGWDTKKWQPIILPLKVHEDEVNSVAFNKDNTKIVSGSRDKTVHIWDINTKEHISLTGHTDLVASVTFNKDGTKVVSGSHDNTIRIWDVKTKKYMSLIGHTNSVTSVALNHDDTKIVSGSLDNTIRIWDVNTKKYMSLIGHTNSVTSVAFSKDSTKIVSGSLDKTIRIWDVKTGEAIGKSLTNDDVVTSVDFNNDGTKIVSASIDNTVRVWYANSKFFGHKFLIFSIVFNPKNKNEIISGSRDKSLRFWDAKTGAATGETLSEHSDAIYAVAISPDGKSMISGGYKNELLLWNKEKGTYKKLEGHKDAVTSVAFNKDGTKIISGSDDKTIRLWDSTGTGMGIVGKHNDKIHSVAFSPDGNSIASGGKDKRIRIWNISDGKQINEMKFDEQVRAVIFGKDEKTIISAGKDKKVSIWDLTTNKKIVGTGHDNLIYAIAFCPAENKIVSGSRDKTLRLWHAETAKQIGNPLKDYTNEIQSVAFSEDCKEIISSSRDSTLRVWKTAWAESFETLLKDTCEELRDHSIISQPKGSVANAAKHQCESTLKNSITTQK